MIITDKKLLPLKATILSIAGADAGFEEKGVKILCAREARAKF